MKINKLNIFIIVSVVSFLFGVWAEFLCASNSGCVTYKNPACIHIYSKHHGDITYKINYSNGEGESPSKVLVYPDKIIIFTKNGEFEYDDYLTFEVIRGVDEMYELKNEKG